MNDISQTGIPYAAHSQERYQYNPNQVAQTATNKTQKSFNFDLQNQNQDNSQLMQYGKKSGHSQTKTNAKKMLNLTGTMQKNLMMSPANHSNNKHKHAEYFESANTLAYNQFESTIPVNLRNPGGIGSENNPSSGN